VNAHPEPTLAPHGEATVEVTIRFFTSHMVGGDMPRGTIVPGHAWTRGDVALAANASHGLPRCSAKFNSLLELSAKIEQVLIGGGVTLYSVGKNARYVRSWPDAAER
jgi:hypothetical protein